MKKNSKDKYNDIVYKKDCVSHFNIHGKFFCKSLRVDNCCNCLFYARMISLNEKELQNLLQFLQKRVGLLHHVETQNAIDTFYETKIEYMDV